MRTTIVIVTLLAVLGGTLHTADARACEEGNAAGPVVELQIARDVQSRQPVDAGQSFAPGKLYAWTRVTGGDGDFTVYHVWIRDGKRLWKQPVSVKGKRWVTWSWFKATPGAWQVDVEGPDGKVLATATFAVK